MMPDEFELAVDKYAELHEPTPSCTVTRREYAKAMLEKEREWASNVNRSLAYLRAYQMLLTIRMLKLSGDDLTALKEQQQMAYVDRLWHYMSDQERDVATKLCDPDVRG